MNTKLPVILVALFAFAVATTPAAHAAPPTDACSLLSPAQVSEVAGTSVGAGTALLPTDTKDCQWRPTGAGAKIRVQLFLKDPQALAMAKTPVAGKIVVAASGIGEDAVYTSSQGTPSVLTVKKGNVVFSVHVLSYGLADDKVKTMEKTLALNVLAKL
jgi:hypothetical protein